MEIKLSNSTVTMPDKWQELKLSQYLDYVGVASIKRETHSDLDDMEMVLRIIEIFLDLEPGGLDNYSMADSNILIDSVVGLLNNIKSSSDEVGKDTIDINGITYKIRNQLELNDLTTGEYISIETIRKQYENNYTEYVSHLLAIIIRPATHILNKETGEYYWQMDNFDKKDIMNLEFRSKLLKDQKAGDLVPILNFFTNGK